VCDDLARYQRFGSPRREIAALFATRFGHGKGGKIGRKLVRLEGFDV
jgi:hypothetical protein